MAGARGMRDWIQVTYFDPDCPWAYKVWVQGRASGWGLGVFWGISDLGFRV